MDISNQNDVRSVFAEYSPNIVINLAAQAGVRYSISHPEAYVESNLVGFFTVLEACRYSSQIEHLIFASSSSVYGNNSKIPYSIEDKTDSPVSLYAATKKSNELLAYSYSMLYGIPITGLRFFTVYGPMGRPDMAYYGFAEKLCNGEKINIFNYGKCERDFTYIDDIVTGLLKVIDAPAPRRYVSEERIDPPCLIYNLGNNNPVNLLDFVHILFDELVKSGLLDAEKELNDYLNLVPMQKGDVAITYADMQAFEERFNYRPKTELRDGLRKFVEWYKYYRDDKNK